jgi:predicted 3-demethylubiquinone-9 3-methyltransferase (glyoxalase superfamily)
MQKITPFLWFDTQAEEAANYYVSIFANSRILMIARYGEAGPGPKDRYGLSWQLVPTVLPELLGDKDSARAQRAMQAMLKMGKLDIAALKRAHQGAA